MLDELFANPDIAALNAKIKGNPDLPPLAERIPAEPLVVVPYDTVGKYGGTLDVLERDRSRDFRLPFCPSRELCPLLG